MNKLRPVERAYIAGFFDGEGCVHFQKRAGRPIFVMTQRTPEVMQKIHSMLGCGNLYVQHRTDGNSPVMWKLSMRREEDMCDFIRAISRYSVVKREKLLEAKRWLKD